MSEIPKKYPDCRTDLIGGGAANTLAAPLRQAENATTACVTIERYML